MTEELLAGPLHEGLRRLTAGTPYRQVVEELLLALPLRSASALSMRQKEGRGAWLPLLTGNGGEALVCGDALSGTLVALARAGWRVTALDRCPLRLAWARRRDTALARGDLRAVLGDPDGALPFGAERFDLAIAERAPRDSAELARVARGEVVVLGENRLGYKRSSGVRADLRLLGPLELARRALLKPGGERTLGGWRRAVAPAGRARAFALYPHSLDFSHVVALDAPRPRLSIGPKERRNLLKILAYRAGLFPALAPSFALFARGRGTTRLERVLAALAERLDEPRPEADIIVATRGDNCLVQTAVPGADEDDPAGRWVLHIPHSGQQKLQMESHHRRLGELRARFPSLPVPEPLHQGEVEGLALSCERRLGGLTSPQITGEHLPVAAMLADVAVQLPGLVLERVTIDHAVFEELIGAKFELVAGLAAVPSTVAALARMRAEVRERLLGREVPRVVYHGDLRSKHVQVTPSGRVLGYLDWGTSVDSDLPYFDLLHLVAHERKQEADLSAGEAWRLVMDGTRLRDHERAALATYRERVSLDPEVASALELVYPVLVGATAEKNWAFSRPRWLHRNFGL